MKKLFILLSLSFGLISVTYADVKTNIMKFKALNACEKCDLSGADLRDKKTLETNYEKAQLSGANLSNANLDEVILCNTKMPWGVDDSDC